MNSIRIEPHFSSGSVAQSACTSALWRAIITLLIALSMSTVSSASPRPALKELFRTDWTSRDGAPSSISDVVQTADGYLWVGSDAGLYRFDGLHFEPFLSPDGKPLPTGPVFSLDVVRDGSLWVGWLMNGCITRIQGANVRSFCTESGLLSTTVNEVTQDGAGKMWAATARGPYVLDGDRWKPVGKELGYDGGIYVVVYADRQGNVWLADEKSVYLRSINDQSFHLLFPHRTIGSFAQERDGTVWGLDTHGEMVALSDRVSARRVWQLGIKALTYDLRFDERGDLWLASVGHGLIRVNNFQHGKAIDNQALEELSLSKGGLTTDKVWKIRQDREGNMWAATSNGLSRFRVSTFSPVELSASLADIGVFPTSDGQMYIAPRNQPLQRLPQPLAGGADSIPVGVSSVYREKDGVEWLGAMDKLWRHDKHGFVGVKRPMPRVEIQTMTSDGHGGLWVAAATTDGLFHYTNGQWIQTTFLPGRSPFSSMLDSQGRVWFGYGRGDIIVLDVTGKKTVFSGSDTQMSGLTNVFLETGTDILVGGENGLRLFRNGRFLTIQSKQPHRFAGISGLVLSGGGDLWINEARDVAVISARELAESEKDPHHEVQVRVFDPQDGLSGNATQSRPLPSATANADGTIWFSLQNSVVRLDPSHLPQNTLSPPVHIESLTADDKTILNPNAPRVTPDPSTVRIAYSGLSLAIPERVNFRYKLEGVDQDWQDVGTRREAIYTKLSPGSYRFQVIAANEDGVWNAEGAVLRFQVPPKIWETLWFRGVCLLLILILAWRIIVWRIRVNAIQLTSHLSQRMAERERIARELHDTLLQGVQGVIYKCSNAIKTLPAESKERCAMESALDEAETVMVQGRDRVGELRLERATDNELAKAIRAVGDECCAKHPLSFELKIQGDVRLLHAIVREEIYWILKEAITNAFAHSNGTEVVCSLDYQKKQFTASVEDDGQGLSDETLRSGRSGHWGMKGMTERALLLKGKLTIAKAEKGAKIEIQLPAAVAYLGKTNRRG